MKYTLAAFLIAACGAAILASWYGLLPEWLHFRPNEPSMKAVTAGGFIHTGLLLAALSNEKAKPGESSLVTLAVLSVTMAAVSACLLWGTVAGTDCPILLTLPADREGAILTAHPGHPSMGTALAFWLTACAGLAGCWRRLWFLTALFGGGVLTLGLLALIGWALHIPALYWYAGTAPTAMAFPTASLFCASGALLVLIAASRHADDPVGVTE